VGCTCTELRTALSCATQEIHSEFGDPHRRIKKQFGKSTEDLQLTNHNNIMASKATPKLKEGQVRIVKADPLNYAVEVVRIVKKKDGPEVLEWKEHGYYGHRLDWAVKSALMQHLPAGKELKGEFEAAAAKIIAYMRENKLD
jgi:hypothetical protein